jgi:imidazolonepropionase-like amidohydrolase
MALRDGATQLKVALSGGFSSDLDQPDDVQFALEELKAAVEVAHSRHTYVTGHAHNSEAVHLGLLAGIECFEHATFLDANTLKEVGERGAAVVATLGVLHRYQDAALREGLRPEIAEQALAAFPAMSDMVRTAIAAGVMVGSGSDQVGPDQCCRGHEVSIRARVTTPLEAISAATGVNARILRVDRETGQLQGGLAADLIAVEGNPVEDPELFETPDRVRLVVRAGVIHKNTLPAPLSAQVARGFEVRTAIQRS